MNNWLRDDLRAQSLPPSTKKSKAEEPRKKEHSVPESRSRESRPRIDTTSEDERAGQKDNKRTGTLDSAPIDRAKSFEYFPGKLF